MLPKTIRIAALLIAALAASASAAQLTDVTQTPNAAAAGIRKSLTEQVGAGRGHASLPGSSEYLIRRDPFRSIQRGRQLFQRKFTAAQGLGPRTNDGIGDPQATPSVVAGLADSCAACHGRPFGSAGYGGNVFTRPESRDAPHLFGLGLKEMLADEISGDLRAIRDAALTQALALQIEVTVPLESKGIGYGSITARPDGSCDTSAVEGVDADLRVRPFFAHGATISIREFVVGAFNDEMGLEAFDADLLAASQGADVVTPAGMHLTGSVDLVQAPPVSSAGEDGDLDGVADEVPLALVDHLEFYLLNYFKPGQGELTHPARQGRQILRAIGCTQCHVEDLDLEHDRRVADVETDYDPALSNSLSRLHAVATPKFDVVDDGSGLPPLKPARGQSFRVRGIFTDFKRHDLGIGFHERNFDGSVRTQFLTTPLWGVGSTAPYGHDGRSLTLEDAILRHGGEAQASRDQFDQLSPGQKKRVLAFLGSLVLFSPPDTASNLNPAQPSDPQYPLQGHGSIDLSVLFNDPLDKE